MKLISCLKGFLIVLCLGWMMSGCQDPILVGGDLLDDEKINIDIIDDFDITTMTVEGERVVTSPALSSSEFRFLRLGETIDNIYGVVRSDLYMKFGFNTRGVPVFFKEEGATFDSLVVILKYDTLASYGNNSARQQIDVYQLDEAYNSRDTFYSDTELGYNPVPIFSNIINVNPVDSVTITEHVSGETVKLAPQLRLKLDDEFALSIFNNSELSVDSTFRQFLKGFYMTSRKVDDKSLLYGFNLSAAALAASTSVNAMVMYYTVGDTLKKSYEYALDNAIISRYELDKSGTVLNTLIDNPELGDSIVITQGYSGAKAKIEFNDLDRLNDILINKAELDIYINDLPVLNNKYNLPTQIIVTRKNSEDKFVFIDDIVYPLTDGLDIKTAFGGGLTKTSAGYKYTINITNYIKQVLKNTEYSPEIYIAVNSESENPARAILYGAGHSEYPIKLKIYYTKE